ncbi:DUF177 domain-containing protein [Acetatifactor muris]|jgi:uncharacterized protein|uniref:DUF177 domain-containing protein n=1 Tax=Acetatifactor muris TaxID=879566 RepID=A0A2K4ZDK4_9FIRM|nr:DUF177 domain-containing protein [Acetatifactor muris]MCR2046881.1 DUF177 domain-containing protein [Acetatifactor muris]SOY28533.1 hypothetical protein AMURIS_01243 [Acetatifactor muris]
MFVNLSDVLTSEGMQLKKEIPLEMNVFECRGERFEITGRTPVSLVITNAGPGRAKIEGGMELTLQAGCDRCLTEVPVELKLEFDRVALMPGGKPTEAEDEVALTEGYQLDTEAFVRNEILINWPVKILCREDCKGICPVCGQNLNMRDCGCDTFVPDPRMAVIQDIFKNKEV